MACDETVYSPDQAQEARTGSHVHEIASAFLAPRTVLNVQSPGAIAFLPHSKGKIGTASIEFQEIIGLVTTRNRSQAVAAQSQTSMKNKEGATQLKIIWGWNRLGRHRLSYLALTLADLRGLLLVQREHQE